MNWIFFSKIGSIFLRFNPIIKWENTSAISSEAVDLEYSVKKPSVFLYVSNPSLSLQVEHLAYSNSSTLKLDHTFS